MGKICIWTWYQKENLVKSLIFSPNTLVDWPRVYKNRPSYILFPVKNKIIRRNCLSRTNLTCKKKGGILQEQGSNLLLPSDCQRLQEKYVNHRLLYQICNYQSPSPMIWHLKRNKGGKKRWIITKNGTGQKRNPVKGIMEVSEREGHRSKRGTAICSWGIIAVMCVGPADPLEQ